MALSDLQRQLIRHSELCALVFGFGGDFTMIRADIEEADEAEKRSRIVGVPFVGVMGLCNGSPVVMLCEGNHDAPFTASFAGVAFAKVIAEHLRAHEPVPPTGDAAEWLARLHSLEDERP